MVQGSEWIVIVLVALVVFGPERLPDLSRKLGRWARELRTAVREMREGLEAEVSEVKKAKDELSDPIREVRRAVRDTARLAAETNPTRLEWKGPKPVSGPTPAEALADLDRIEQGNSPSEDQAPSELEPGPPSIKQPPAPGQPGPSSDSSEEPT